MSLKQAAIYIWYFMWTSWLPQGKKYIVNTQKKMRKEAKHNTKESYQTTKEERKRRKEQKGTTKIRK